MGNRVLPPSRLRRHLLSTSAMRRLITPDFPPLSATYKMTKAFAGLRAALL